MNLIKVHRRGTESRQRWTTCLQNVSVGDISNLRRWPEELHGGFLGMLSRGHHERIAAAFLPAGMNGGGVSDAAGVT